MPASGSVPPSSEAQTRRMPERMESGSMLGRYTIEGAIGEGGMGVVYRARDARLGRKVALKVLQAHEGDPESIERAKRFLREARTAAALDHPNAVSIFDVGEAGELSFIAMELVNGQPLRAFVGAPEPDVSQRLRWLLDVASALGAAHDARIIHRDVKPENVMIREDGRVKVLDFGLARRAAAPRRERSSGASPEHEGLPQVSNDVTFTETGQTTLTAVGTLLGTPQYMAPEQIRSEPLDPRSDQFSWGVLAYELLTGELPWKGSGIHVMARILIDEPTPIRELEPRVPEEAAAVVMRALSRPAADRFASMTDVIDALDPYAVPASRSDPRSIRHRSATPRAFPTAPPPTAENKTQRSADHVPPQGPAPSPKPVAVPRVAIVEVGHAAAASGRDGEDPSRPPDPGGAAPEEPLRARGLLLGVAVLSLAIGGVIAWRTVGRGGAPPPPPPVASGVPTTLTPWATAVTELPDPHAASPEALAAYRAGLTELRFGGVRESLERATVLDPSFAAAHLQCAVDAAEFDLDAAGRAHLRKATDLRAELGERDQLLLDALGPVLLRQPADFAEAGRRLAAATDRFPGDAQLWYERGVFAQISEGPEASAPFVERATSLDPQYGQAMSLMAQDLAYMGRFPEARATLSRCIAMAPSSVTCAQGLARILDHDGACEEEEAMARQFVTASPETAVAQGVLAQALAARGRPEAAVREALKLRWAALPPAERKPIEAEETLALELLAGDFVAAEHTAKEIEAAVEPSRRESAHGSAARHLVQIYVETGRLADAGRVADAYLGRRDAWEPDARSEDYAMAADAMPELLFAALRAGKMTRADLTARRAEWVQGWEKKAPPFFRHYVWAHGFAAPVETADEARDALAALPAYEPLPPFDPMAMSDAAVGHAFLLGGRTADALASLNRATSKCRVLTLPVEHTRAHLWLGLAREASGDKEGACAAYRVVRDRWGKAKPRSVTAEKAGERQRALGCPAG
jgi:serine/threonine protein kinase/Flp pilus assembly protein TadD